MASPPPCISEQPVAYAGDLGLGGETPCPLSTLYAFGVHIQGALAPRLLPRILNHRYAHGLVVKSYFNYSAFF